MTSKQNTINTISLFFFVWRKFIYLTYLLSSPSCPMTTALSLSLASVVCHHVAVKTNTGLAATTTLLTCSRNFVFGWSICRQMSSLSPRLGAYFIKEVNTLSTQPAQTGPIHCQSLQLCSVNSAALYVCLQLILIPLFLHNTSTAPRQAHHTA